MLLWQLKESSVGRTGSVTMTKKTTARQRVLRYAQAHGLDTSGSQKEGFITVIDTLGHWSESWSFGPFETWAEAEAALAAIEREYIATLARPWETARKSYTGKMKPLAA
jgi:hypothetical protein